MNQSKQYRWNVNSYKWEMLNPNFVPTRDLEQIAREQWINVPAKDVPKEVRDRSQTLIERYKDKAKLKLQQELQKAGEQEELHINIPLGYISKVIKRYIYLKQHQHITSPAQRLVIVKYIFFVRFGDLKRLTGDPTTSEYDHYYINDFLIDYCSRYSCKQYSPSFKNLIKILADYLDPGDTKKIQQKFEDNVERYDKQISASNPDDINWSWDDFIKPKSQFEVDQSAMYRINDKPSKRYPLAPSWKENNKIHTPYTDMNEEQRHTYDEMSQIINLAKKQVNGSPLQKLLYTVANELQQKLKILESIEVKRSVQKGNVDNNYLDLINHKILHNFEYTNPLHINALIRNYFALWDTYRHQTNSPLYSVLAEIKEVIEQIQFTNPVHKRIVEAFLHNSSYSKKNAEYLGIDTEKMNRTLKQSISKKIAKFFQKTRRIAEIER